MSCPLNLVKKIISAPAYELANLVPVQLRLRQLLHDYTKENSVELATALKFKAETII
jgi:hypothetical protein